ncbi:MAG: CCA tRNA nucleotidyltransferase [Candidatus Marinimicrobia bacterium]|jgi:tRNA nucleotidyltransferase (CCA-adding enzyme)|nr:CCA tRNA nucleotidyltransferase [Candidatus Neomarinimicrobiota bacterium]|tara:strand:- start:670 stop:2010 length:1341 start_codon:yes stop_codon:yes gene_type:complete
MTSVIELAKKIALPSSNQVSKVNKNANEAFKLVNKECTNHNEVVSIQFGGSYAKGTWTPEKIDIDIFVKLKKSTSEKKFLELAKKIGFNALKKYKPYVRYSEHPFVEALVGGTLVNVVPCYDVKKGEWKSAADRSTFHTEFMSEKLTGQMKNDISLLKCMMKANGVYGAEIANQGFSGYVTEVLVYYFGSFSNVLKEVSKIKKNGRIGKSPRKFDSPIIIIDPIDGNRNLGAAISMENVAKFVLLSRVYLKKPSLSFFKSKKIKPKNEKRLIKNTIVISFSYKNRSEDIIFGQIKRAANSFESQLTQEGFRVLRNDAMIYDNEKAAILILLEDILVNKNQIKTGPEFFEDKYSNKFIQVNVKKSKLMWVDKHGKLQSVQKRNYYDAKMFLNKMLKMNLTKFGIPKGLQNDFKMHFSVILGDKITNKSIKTAISKLTSTNATIFSSN